MLKLQCCDHKSIQYSVFKVMESKRKARLLILDTSKLKFIKADTINSRALDDTPTPPKKELTGSKRKSSKISIYFYIYLYVFYIYMYKGKKFLSFFDS